jgi:replication factor A1
MVRSCCPAYFDEILLSTIDHRFDGEGAQSNFQSFQSTAGAGAMGSFKPSDSRTLAQIKDEQLGMTERTDFFNARATVIYVKHDNLSYPACPADRCNKKMTLEGNDQWRCEKCDTTYPAPEYRWVTHDLCIVFLKGLTANGID